MTFDSSIGCQNTFDAMRVLAAVLNAPSQYLPDRSALVRRSIDS